MAYYDHAAEAHRQECEKRYEELKKFICSIEQKGKNKGKISEWFLAHEHIVKMEQKIKQQEKQLQEYRSFFSMLSNLTPKRPSIHDAIF